MDSNSLLKLSLQIVQELVFKVQRSHRLPAVSCTWDNLHEALPFDADLAKTKLSYLFRQPEYPQTALKSESKEFVLKLLSSAYQQIRTPTPRVPVTPISSQQDVQPFIPFFLANMMGDKIRLSAFVKPSGERKWFAQSLTGHYGRVTAVSYGVSGIEFTHSPLDALKTKGIQILPGTQQEVKVAFLREYNVPPPADACSKLVEAIACHVVMPLSMAIDRSAIRLFTSQFVDDPTLGPQHHPKPQ